jgi:uncharacterized membrane protein YhaH (DUF805 family)
MESFINIYKDVLTNKYAEFDGRAGRQEFWSFVLVNFLVSLVLGVVGSMIDSSMLGNLYSLAVFVPGIALGARRLHDIGKSGWWQLLALIPVIGWIILIIWAVTPGEITPNAYGSALAISAPMPTESTPPTEPTPPTQPTEPTPPTEPQA